MANNQMPPGATQGVQTGKQLAGHIASAVGTASGGSGLDGHMVADIVPVGKSGTMPYGPQKPAGTLFQDGNFHD